MPWAWIIVTAVTGLGSGALGTLLKISHDRQAEVRRQALAMSQEFAACAPQWLASIEAMITARWNDSSFPPEESEPAYQAAVASVRDARASLGRLLVALPQRSMAARSAISVVDSLAAAVEELRVWPWSEREEAQDPDFDLEELSEEEYADYVAEAEAEPIMEAKTLRGLAEEALGNFIYESAGELRAGIGSEVRRAGRRVVFVSKAPQRALKKRRTERAMREEHEATLARLRERRRQIEASGHSPDPSESS